MMTPDLAPLPDAEISAREQSELLEKALHELPADQADMVRQAFLEEKTHADIAAETGVQI